MAKFNDPKQAAAWQAQYEDAQREIQLAPKSGTVVARSLGNLQIKRARWLWAGRIPRGELMLIAGREGTGKSTVAVDVAAKLSRGELAGDMEGQVRATLIAATEDSFENTIGPRLLAAGADMDQMYEIVTKDTGTGISLPSHILGLEEEVIRTDAAFVIFDPLISRLGNLDTHRDAEVRQALEPLVDMAHRLNIGVAGLIHLNKSGDEDPLRQLMGSTAFSAMPRSVLYAAYDPDDDSRTTRLLAHAKCNIGRYMPTLSYRIGERVVGNDEGDIHGTYIEWDGEDDRNVFEVAAGPSAKQKQKKETCASWLFRFLNENGPVLASSVKAQARLELNVSASTVDRAAVEINVVKTRNNEFQAGVLWALA